MRESLARTSAAIRARSSASSLVLRVAALAVVAAILLFGTAGGARRHQRRVADADAATRPTAHGTTTAPAPPPATTQTVAPPTTVTVPISPAARRRAVIARQRADVRRLAARGLPLYCGGAQKRMVALTFDDGPGNYTHYAIAKLEAAHLHATFFLVGKEILGWPGLAQREERVAAFGDHTLTHPYLPLLPLKAAIAQIRGDQQLIERTVHRPVQLFRPPYEGHTPAIDAAVRRLGMVEVLWDVDSGDSLGANYRQIEHSVIAGLRPGSIILMHENHGQTIRALRVIFAALRHRHLKAVTIPQLIAQDPPSPAQLRKGWLGCPTRPGAGSGG